MKHEFKPGDKARMAVELVRSDSTRLKKGEVVTVIKSDQSEIPYLVRSEDGRQIWAMPGHLEPIDTPEFQVGDTVYDPVLFPGPDPEVPYPGKVVEIGTAPYPIQAEFNGKSAVYTADSRYLGSFQPTLSKTFYRFVREEIKSKPDLDGLAKKLDEILEVETKESLSRWLDDRLNPKWQPKRGEAVLVGVEGGYWFARVANGKGFETYGDTPYPSWDNCIPFDPELVGKPVKP